VLQCAYHGWRFDPTGACIEIPALGPGARLPPAAQLSAPAGLVEAHGIVFLAPEEPIAPLGSIPEADDPSFEVGELPTLVARASAGLLADNFLDVAHFPFVHAGTFGADEAAEVPQYAVARDDWSFTMSYEHPFANREDPGVAAGVRPLVQTRRLSYRLSAPFHLRLRIDFVEAQGTNVIGFFIQPETADSCRLFTTLWRDDVSGDPVRMAEAVEFEVAVLREDLRIQESFYELALPLELTAEVHTRADRTTLELRRVLADLVATVEG
jgi:vanillate O-demethylase monooxygenase subunit